MNTAAIKTAWIEQNRPLAQFLRFIYGYNLDNVKYCETKLWNSLTEKSDFSNSSLESASAKLLLPTRIILGGYMRFSLYLIALYPILIGCFIFSKSIGASSLLFLIGAYYPFWYHKGFHPILKSQINAVKTAKENIRLKIILQQVTTFFEQKFLMITDKIESLVELLNKKDASETKRENYHSSKKILLQNLIKLLSKNSSAVDLGKNVNVSDITKFSKEAGCTEATIKKHLCHFKNIDSFMKQKSSQLVYFIKPLNELMNSEAYQSNIKYKSTVDSLLNKIMHKVEASKK